MIWHDMIWYDMMWCDVICIDPPALTGSPWEFVALSLSLSLSLSLLPLSLSLSLSLSLPPSLSLSLSLSLTTMGAKPRERVLGLQDPLQSTPVNKTNHFKAIICHRLPSHDGYPYSARKKTNIYIYTYIHTYIHTYKWIIGVIIW